MFAMIAAIAMIVLPNSKPPADVAVCLIEHANRTMWITPSAIQTQDGHVTVIYGHGVRAVSISTTDIQTPKTFGHLPERDLERCAS